MIQTYKDALAYIYDFHNSKGYDLDKMRNVAKNLGNPQNSYKVIHITGTNGKGSTCNMCFSVLKKAEKKVGIFTSPHLLDIRERFKTDEGMISKDDLLHIVQKIEPYAKELSYFEKCTLIAFEYFRQQQ
ncbi:MAG: bifunctional folylpolyglutamate synthase/dihydrofolate synthase, partial [Candidatus Absconditabacteria bacterium]